MFPCFSETYLVDGHLMDFKLRCDTSVGPVFFRNALHPDPIHKPNLRCGKQSVPDRSTLLKVGRCSAMNKDVNAVLIVAAVLMAIIVVLLVGGQP